MNIPCPRCKLFMGYLLSTVMLLCGSLVIYDYSRIFDYKEHRINRKLQITFAENSASAVKGYVLSEKIYGYAHMARTGGSKVNGVLASRFERICGNKGYSFDAYNTMMRRRSYDNPFKYTDSISTVTPDYKRFKVPDWVMNEIGYEECDWISSEIGTSFWKQFNSGHIAPMELHVPCRDPIEHLMSVINYRRHTFNCQAEDIYKEINFGLMWIDRFSMKLKTSVRFKDIDVKCFDNRFATTKYLDHMASILQPRRKTFKYLDENVDPRLFKALDQGIKRFRQKEDECIWKDFKIHEKVRKYLINNVDYYKFCNSCIGSEDDLFP